MRGSRMSQLVNCFLAHGLIISTRNAVILLFLSGGANSSGSLFCSTNKIQIGGRCPTFRMFLLALHWAPFQHWLHRGALSDALHGTCSCLSPAISVHFLRGTWHHSLWVLVTHPAVVSAWWGQDLICPLLYTLHLVHHRCSVNVTRVLYRADWEDTIPMLCVRKLRPRGACGSLRAPQSLPFVASSALFPPPPTRFHLPGALGTTHQLALWLQTPRGCVSALWLPFAYIYMCSIWVNLESYGWLNQS